MDGEEKLQIMQLRLIHHYTTVTARSLIVEPCDEAFWASCIVDTAFRYPFLLHLILALAAVHLTRLEDISKVEREGYTVQAETHYETALASFPDLIGYTHNSTREAIIMFANLQFPYSCAAFVHNKLDLKVALCCLCSTLEITRKARPVLLDSSEALQGPNVTRMIPGDVAAVDWSARTPPSETELHTIRELSKALHLLCPQDTFEACDDAIESLIFIFAVVSRSHTVPSSSMAKIWIYLVPARFMELLSDGQPGALIILAHYAVLLWRSQHHWYLEGMAVKILTIVDSLIQKEWKSWLQWPKEQMYDYVPYQ